MLIGKFHPSMLSCLLRGYVLCNINLLAHINIPDKPTHYLGPRYFLLLLGGHKDFQMRTQMEIRKRHQCKHESLDYLFI